MATYQQNKPEENDNQDVSQVDLQQNFEANNETWNVDHIAPDPNTGGNRGKHNKVTFVKQSASPTPGANECVFYAKDVSTETLPYATYIKADSSTANVPILPQITAGTSGNFKIGGVAFVWGVTSNATTGTNQTIPVSFGSNFSSAPWFFSATRTTAPGGNDAISYGSLTQSGVNINSFTSGTGTAQNFNWLAIGPAA